MFESKKEKRVVELALQHAGRTGECLEAMTDAVKAFLSGNGHELSAAADRVSKLESEADGLLREIRELLYSGAYLPLIRGDVYHMMSSIDNVANKTEDCFDFFYYQKPVVPEEYRAEILTIVELTLNCFDEFRMAFEAFLTSKGKKKKLRRHAKEVSELESRIDARERALTARIFDSSLPLSNKLHLRRFVSYLVRITDVVENAADELQLVNLKALI